MEKEKESEWAADVPINSTAFARREPLAPPYIVACEGWLPTFKADEPPAVWTSSEHTFDRRYTPRFIGGRSFFSVYAISRPQKY